MNLEFVSFSIHNPTDHTKTMNIEQLKKAIAQEEKDRVALGSRIETLTKDVDRLNRWIRQEQEEIKTNEEIIAMQRDADKPKFDSLVLENESLRRIILRRQEDIKNIEGMIDALNAVDKQKRETIDQRKKELKEMGFQEEPRSSSQHEIDIPIE